MELKFIMYKKRNSIIRIAVIALIIVLAVYISQIDLDEIFRKIKELI